MTTSARSPTRAPRPPEPGRPHSALLLDLDGTLADTAPDLGHALNAVLIEEGLQPLAANTIRPAVSHGSPALIQLGFGLTPNDPRAAPLQRRLLDHYQQRLYVDTRLFPGMSTLLHQCEMRGLRWGVVTNKPARLTGPLMEHLGLNTRAASVVSGDTLDRAKPHPEPVWHACRTMAVAPAEAVFVGDAERDIQAGRRAGAATLVALFGYLGDGDEPATWHADGCVAEAAEIAAWLAL